MLWLLRVDVIKRRPISSERENGKKLGRVSRGVLIPPPHHLVLLGLESFQDVRSLTWPKAVGSKVGVEIFGEGAKMQVIPASHFGYGTHTNILPLLGNQLGLTEWDKVRADWVSCDWRDFQFVRLTAKARAIFGWPDALYVVPPTLPLL